MKNRNVLIAADYAAEFEGAFIRSIYCLTHYLKKNHYNVFFLFSAYKSYMYKFEELGEIYIYPIHGKRFDIKAFIFVFNIIKNNNIRLVHSQFGIGLPIICSLNARIFKIKHIWHWRSSIKLINEKNTIKKNIKIIFYRVFFFLFPGINIAISSNIYKNLKENNIIRKSYVVNNAIDINSYDVRKEKHKNFNLCMIANFTKQKDHLTVLKSFNLVNDNLKDIKLILIGAPTATEIGNTYSDIHKYIIDNKLQNLIDIKSNVMDISSILNITDLGMLISNYEGFGNSIIEFMLFEIPVIATRVEGITDIIKDKFNGLLIDKGDYKDLARKIIKLYQNNEISEYLAKNGKETVLKKFTIDLWVNKIFKIYEDILN